MKFFYSILTLLLLLSCESTIKTPEAETREVGIIIENDDFFSDSHWNDPHLLKEGDEYIMYASSNRGWAESVVRIYRLTSQDGESWSISNGGNPVLEPGVAGSWDSHSVETPAVVYYNGEYHMFYTGYDVAYDYTDMGEADNPWDDDNSSKHFGIGHATSPDGIEWTRVQSDPVHTATAPYTDVDLSFDQFTVGEPAPVVFNGRIYLYFTAMGAASEVNTTWQTIGLIIFNGASWDTPRRVLLPELNLYPRNNDSGIEYIGYSTPNAIVLNGMMHLFVDVAENEPWRQVKIHHAVSPDGESGWQQDSTPLLNREDYFWTADEIRSPAALEVDDMLYLYFAGHYDGATSDPKLCIGLNIYYDF